MTVRLMQEPLKALTQSYSRTKARNYTAFRETMELHTNSSNNTIYADADGTIAYFHANFIPRRDPKFDWTQAGGRQRPGDRVAGPAVGGRVAEAAEPGERLALQHQQLAVDARPGPSSPKKADFPAYVDSGSENPRGIHAIRLFENRKDFTLDRLLAAAYDSYLPAFAEQIPAARRGVGPAARGRRR